LWTSKNLKYLRRLWFTNILFNEI